MEKHHHHILPNSTALAVGGALLFLTVVTVWVAGVDLGRLNFLIAMVVASIKATLVALFFMNLLYDRKENAVIFATSFLFLAIFIVFTATDLFFRGDVYVKGGVPEAFAQSKSKLAKPWVSTPELVGKGRELFSQQCVACHGAQGKGDGPAAASLVPPPRNFTQAAGWKNGRKPSQIFKTLKEGIPGSAMASFATLSSDDRWALAHYVTSLGPNPEQDTNEDLAKIGIDPSKAGGGEAQEAPTIPIEVAMKRLTKPEAQPLKAPAQPVSMETPGARLFVSRCASCHGASGEGGQVVQAVGGKPAIQVRSAPLKGVPSLASPDAFNKVVINGLPGALMPGSATLSGSELQELYQYVRSATASLQ